MSTAKFVLFGALGAAALLLLTSERARKIRVGIEDKAKENADVLKDKLWSLTGSASHTVTELKELLADEVDGLSAEARARIEAILNKTVKSTNGLKKPAMSKLA